MINARCLCCSCYHDVGERWTSEREGWHQRAAEAATAMPRLPQRAGYNAEAEGTHPNSPAVRKSALRQQT